MVSLSLAVLVSGFLAAASFFFLFWFVVVLRFCSWACEAWCFVWSLFWGLGFLSALLVGFLPSLFSRSRVAFCRCALDPFNLCLSRD